MNIDYYGHTVACHEYLGDDSTGLTPNFAKYI